MKCTPSESERRQAVLIQILAIFLYFLPGMIAQRTSLWQSAYVRFWVKGNTIWSLIMFVPVAILFVLGFAFNARAPLVVVWSVHAMMCIMCAFASMFNRPVGYFIVTNYFCAPEMGEAYGGTRSSDDSDPDASS